MISSRTVLAALTGVFTVSGTTLAIAQEQGGSGCDAIPLSRSVFSDLQQALNVVVDGQNAGLSNEMWASIVDRDGIVCAVTFSGGDRAAQWPGSRVISAQKANTANAFSLDADDGAGIALSSGNLYGLVQPGGSLFGLQFSNPVDPRVAYGDNQASTDGADNSRPPAYGTRGDPMVGSFIGGVNVFGGGLALYDPSGRVVGGLGVSGDTSCTDHIVAWRVRDWLNLDSVPGGVGDGGASDNLILADPPTPNSFEHPNCGDQGEVELIDTLAADFPLG